MAADSYNAELLNSSISLKFDVVAPGYCTLPEEQLALGQRIGRELGALAKSYMSDDESEAIKPIPAFTVSVDGDHGNYHKAMARRLGDESLNVVLSHEQYAAIEQFSTKSIIVFRSFPGESMGNNAIRLNIANNTLGFGVHSEITVNVNSEQKNESQVVIHSEGNKKRSIEFTGRDPELAIQEIKVFLPWLDLTYIHGNRIDEFYFPVVVAYLRSMLFFNQLPAYY